MLTEDEKTEIQREIEQSETPRAACCRGLKIVQKRHGLGLG